MSAYICTREHIGYLVAAIDRYRYHRYRGPMTGEDLRATGQTLWDENIKSVKNRYPNDAPGELPGPIGESFEFNDDDVPVLLRINAVQVLKSANCYEYQSCEHPGWVDSEACRMIRSLVSMAIMRLPGYESAAWGAPENTSKLHAL